MFVHSESVPVWPFFDSESVTVWLPEHRPDFSNTECD